MKRVVGFQGFADRSLGVFPCHRALLRGLRPATGRRAPHRITGRPVSPSLCSVPYCGQNSDLHVASPVTSPPVLR